jgi:hypothetical protein
MRLRVTPSLKLSIVLFILLVLLLYSFVRVETFAMGDACKDYFGAGKCSINPKYYSDMKYGTDTVTEWREYCKDFGDVERKCLQSHEVSTGDFYDEIKGYIIQGEKVTKDDLCIFQKGGDEGLVRPPTAPDYGQWDKPLGTIGI